MRPAVGTGLRRCDVGGRRLNVKRTVAPAQAGAHGKASGFRRAYKKTPRNPRRFSSGNEATDYQIFTCLSPERTIFAPGLHWNAVAKASMFDGAPIARSEAGACGSTLR